MIFAGIISFGNYSISDPFPCLILADAIALPFLLLVGILGVFPCFLLFIYSEGYIISKILKTDYKKTRKFAFWANILSAVAGNPLFIVNVLFPSEFYFRLIAPYDLHTYYKTYIYYSILAYLIFFVITIVVEWLYGLWWRKKNQYRWKVRTLLFSLIMANIFSYIIICPIHYYLASPWKSVNEITKDSIWASQPYEKVFYIDNKNNHLMMADSNGENIHTLVPHPVKHYMFSSDLDNFVFFKSRHELYHYNKNTNQLTKLFDSDTENLVLLVLDSLHQVAMSPSGKKVAWVIKTAEGQGSYGPWELDTWILYVNNLESYTTIEKSFKSYDAELAWSKEEDFFYIRGRDNKYCDGIDGINIVRFLTNNTLAIAPVDQTDEIVLCNNYGRVGRFYYSGGDTFVEHMNDEFNDLHAHTIRGLGSKILIIQNETLLFSFSDTPAIFPIPRRWRLKEPSFISEGKECIFEDGESIYLIDIKNKNIGEIVDGRDHVLINNNYLKKKYFLELTD